MKYALLIYYAAGSDAEAASRAESLSQSDDVFANWIAYTRALKDAGALITLERLHDVGTATSVREREGERLLTDGPFIETKEHLLGFYLIDVPDLDVALYWARRMPHVKRGTVEVRPVMPIPALYQIVLE